MAASSITIAFASASSPQTRVSSSGASSPPRFDAASEWRPAIDRPVDDVLDPGRDRVASPVGKTPSFVNESSAATESTGVVPIASRRERAVSTAPSAFVVRTTRSAPRAASSFVAPSTPSSAARRLARAPHRASRSRRRIRPRASRTASAIPKLPVPPISAIFTCEPSPRPPESSARAAGRHRGRS